MALDVMLARAQFYNRAWPSRALFDYIDANGLDTNLVAGFAGCLTVMQVRRFGEDRFDFASGEDGEPLVAAAVIEAYGRDAETTIDLVAWPLDRPADVLTMFGRASLLGVSHVHNPATYYLGKPLVVHRTGLGWLRAGCNGAAVVTPRLAAWDLLEAPGKIAGEDRRHAQELAALVGSLVDHSRFVAPSQPHLRRVA